MRQNNAKGKELYKIKINKFFRQRAKEQIEKIDREKKLQLEVATNQLKVSLILKSSIVK